MHDELERATRVFPRRSRDIRFSILERDANKLANPRKRSSAPAQGAPVAQFNNFIERHRALVGHASRTNQIPSIFSHGENDLGITLDLYEPVPREWCICMPIQVYAPHTIGRIQRTARSSALLAPYSLNSIERIPNAFVPQSASRFCFVRKLARINQLVHSLRDSQRSLGMHCKRALIRVSAEKVAFHLARFARNDL